LKLLQNPRDIYVYIKGEIRDLNKIYMYMNIYEYIHMGCDLLIDMAVERLLTAKMRLKWARRSFNHL